MNISLSAIKTRQVECWARTLPGWGLQISGPRLGPRDSHSWSMLVAVRLWRQPPHLPILLRPNFGTRTGRFSILHHLHSLDTFIADMTDSAHSHGEGEQKKERFAPKVPVQLAPPKDDIITLEHLSKCNGRPCIISLKVSASLTVFYKARMKAILHTLLSRWVHTVNFNYQKHSAGWVHIKIAPQSDKLQGTVFDVTGKETYAPGKGYHGKPIPD